MITVTVVTATAQGIHGNKCLNEEPYMSSVQAALLLRLLSVSSFYQPNEVNFLFPHAEKQWQFNKIFQGQNKCTIYFLFFTKS